MSIFKGEVNARYEVKEKDFILAMKAVGFKFSAKKKGSRRHFVAIGETAEFYGKTPYVYHLHGQVLDKHKQDLIAKDLRVLYDWNAQTFVLENVREE
ncbi:hypothetical protein K466DRAFT_608035 [Polyporus arcularius HHB13444]|uniref:Uncharacterized protein n=1 Tax=Polyporus arcularius HHB13444 TaxID=1314778 RepID=A0A5C3NIJ1_9APHY|nr:hypothetical protein K466DRAFT_608035 [Polyporus arcularius HHB13444]